MKEGMIMDTYKWQDELANFHLPKWQELPDIPIYMDQLVTLINRYTLPFKLETSSPQLVTAAMINNYVKQKLILPPEKKKYDQRHIARLIIITTLKQCFDMSTIQQGIVQQISMANDYEKAYDHFCNQMESTVHLFLAKPSDEHLELRVPNPLYQPIQMATIALTAKLVTEKSVQALNNTLLTKEQIE